MKKNLFILVMLFAASSLFAQSFNTGEILQPGHFSAGVNPVLNEKDLAVFLHGGYGISNKVDLAVRYGIFEGEDYIGADLEWSLKNSQRYQFSLITGGHMRHDFGLDAGLCLSLPLGSYASLFSGVDMDLEFANEFKHYTWVPLGVELSWKNRMSIILEADIPMSEWAWHIFGGGIAIYF
jgi:hypothetical protein